MITDVLLKAAAPLGSSTRATEPFSNLMIDGHREKWPLRSKRLLAWLRPQYYERTWDAPAPSSLSAVLSVQFDGPEPQVSVRLAEQDGMVYLDLAGEFWRAIEIGARHAMHPYRRGPAFHVLDLTARNKNKVVGYPLDADIKLNSMQDLAFRYDDSQW